jgi:hypothetical protein
MLWPQPPLPAPAGDADAYGTIADCYTDMGDLEKAGVYYDKYIERMNKDGPV